MLDKIIQFLKEVRVELSKVHWPTRREMVVYTAIVLSVSTFLALFLGALDWVFASILNKFVL